MSLLDDVSIVVTPNGYKAGTLFGAIPVPTEGAELVTNGDFATDSDWNLDSSFSISGGLLTQNGTAGRTFQSISALETGLGTYIKVTFTVEAISSGQFHISCYGVSSPVVTTTGTYTFTGVTSDTTNLYVNNGGYYANGSISNISVKTFLSADMDVTRATDATRIDENGLIEDVLANVPRIDYTGGGCPHILVEPQRTNIVFPSDVAVTQTRTVTAVEYALSFYGTGSIVLSGTHSATLTGTGANDRVDLIFTPTAGSLVLTVSGTITNFQLEVGSYATSLIPTVSGQVTRNQDIFTRDGIGSLINSTEGVLFVEMAALSDDNARRTVSLSDGSNNNRVILRYGDSSNRVQGFIKVGGATNGDIINDSYTITNFLKIAYKWKAGDFALWINGTEVGTSADATSFGTGVLTELQFNQGDGTGDEYFGKVKQLQVYDTALTDEQLEALTS